MTGLKFKEGEYYRFGDFWDGSGDGQELLESGCIYVYYEDYNEDGEKVMFSARIGFGVDRTDLKESMTDAEILNTYVVITDISEKEEAWRDFGGIKL